MRVNVIGKQVKGKRLGDLDQVKNLARKFGAAAKYNHIRVQFPSGDEKHLLFTDWQIKLGLKRANKNPEDLPKVSWIRDIIVDEISLFDESRMTDLQEVVNKKKVPQAASKYNHIRVLVAGEECHMLFTDKDVIVALDRAKKNTEDLPKTSWLKDMLD
jgi:hypothetical protein